MEYYVYVYLDPRKKGKYIFGEYSFEYEPIYVGKGKRNRVKDHLWEAQLKRDGNQKKVNKIRKILNEGYQPIIIKLHEQLNEETALQLEQKIINLIGRGINNTGTLTNMTEGGENSPHPSKEAIKRIAELSRQRMLVHNPMKNPETAKKVSEYHKTIKHTDEYKEKMRQSLLNSDAHKIACQNPVRNYKLHIYQKANTKSVAQYDLNMKLITTYESISEASRRLHIRKGDISAVINGRQKKTHKYIFKLI